ncbi:MAG: hypothetical protein ACOC44_01730 [Promethearchaeia archaeon]
MGIDKWISKEEKKKKKVKNGEKGEPNLKEEALKKAKLEKIREIITSQNDVLEKGIENENGNYNDDFLNYIAEFKEWLNQRTYLKGDINKLQIWIKNLYNKMENPSEKTVEANLKQKKGQLKEDFKLIPPDLVQDEIRIAVTKKLHGRKQNSSDNYYLRKLKKIIREKLKKAKYYKILKEILDTL